MAPRSNHEQKQRRRPVQPRAQETSRAIREAFVRLLDERPFERLTIREITMVAGVGLGTFYEYFGSKDELARATVHLRTKALLQALRRRRGELGPHDVAQGVHAAIDGLMTLVRQRPAEWTQHFLLERQKTDLASYRSAYERFVEEWRRMLEASSDWPAEAATAQASRAAFTAVYGMLTHALMRAGGPPPLDRLQQELEIAALACLTASRDQRA